MKKTSKRVLVSMLTLLLAVVAIGTTTFAWFTIGNIGTVSGIDASVTGGEGLQIKMVTKKNDGTTLKETDYMSHLTFDSTFLDDEFSFKALENSSDKKTLEMLGETSTGHLYRGVESHKNVDYIEIELTFRSLKQGANVYLTSLTTDRDSVKNIKAERDFTGLNSDGFILAGKPTVNKGDSYQVYGDYALRLGVVGTDGVVTSYYNGHNQDYNKGQMSYLESMGVKVYDEEVMTTEANVDYKDVLGTGAGNVFPKENDNHILLATLDTAEADTPEGTMQYYTGSVTLRFWIDGWDPHAFNAIYEQLLKINLQLEIKE